MNLKFKLALVKMLEEGEFDKMLKYAKHRGDKRDIRNDMAVAKELWEAGVNKVSVIPVIMNITSPYTFQTMFFYASGISDEELAKYSASN